MEPLRCAMTGRPLHDTGDGIHDDGEWISWEWINSQMEDDEEPEELHERVRASGGAPRILELTEVFLDLVDDVARYRELTGRYLELWGELGEIYAEIRHGLIRHPKHHAGSDGTIGGVLVEVKTISPEKKNDRVHVKRCGSFEKLIIVRISEDLWFSSKIFDRADLNAGASALMRAHWRNEESTP